LLIITLVAPDNCLILKHLDSQTIICSGWLDFINYFARRKSMDVEPLFIAALQSSFLLGLIHGVNPCGHSWLVLTPFITGEKKGSKVATLTAAFLFGTALACLALGATLGTISGLLPPAASFWVEIGTSVLLIIIGILLLYDPEILHKHTHDHSQEDEDNHHHGQHHCCGQHNDDYDHNHVACHHFHNDSATPKSGTKGKWLALSLFGIGFVNMIIPCPTAAVMYGYALNSGSTLTATLVFGSYAVSTAIAVSLVIYCIFKITTMAGRLQKDWVEPLIMRTAGLIIVIFSSYGLYSSLVA
jgi:nickel/cobalt exporter